MKRQSVTKAGVAIRLGAAVGVLLVAASLGIAAESPAVSDVSISRPFFNPSLGQKIGISFTVSQPGSLTVLILDRDGFLVRKLASGKAVEKGKPSFDWDGRDDQNAVVPDEAYYPKIEFASSAAAEVLNPLALPAAKPEYPSIEYYDRQTGQFVYRLSAPSRVHIQAGQAVRNSKTGESDGPVLRTVVDREPRMSGKILETWRGYSADGSVYVPDLQNFVMAVAAEPLPPHALITVGNRNAAFFEYVIQRRSAQETATRDLSRVSGQHHEGLRSLEDSSPDLTLLPAACELDRVRKAWTCREGALAVSVDLNEKRAKYFLSQASRPVVFTDGKRLTDFQFLQEERRILIPAGALKNGSHIIAVNWPTPHGPVAIGVLAVTRGKDGGKT